MGRNLQPKLVRLASRWIKSIYSRMKGVMLGATKIAADETRVRRLLLARISHKKGSSVESVGNVWLR